jgi:hypothetical protein
MKLSNMLGAAFSDDNEDNEDVWFPEKPQEPAEKPNKPKSGMRPPTMRGDSFGYADDGGVPEKHHGSTQKTNKPKKFMRPSTMRGASFSDDDGDDDDDIGVPEKPHEPVEKPMKPKSGMRPPTMRGDSFGYDDDSGVPEKHHESTQKTSKPKSGMRPSNMRGSSFSDDDDDDDDDIGVPEGPHQPTQKSTRPHEHGMRSSFTRGASFGDDDGVDGVAEKQNESTLRPSTRRWQPFSNSDDAPRSPVKRVDDESVAPAPIRVKVKPPLIPSDDNDRGSNVDVKSRVVKSAPTQKKSAVDLEKDRKCKECYKWYARMGQPNCAEMKRRVADMPKSCEITVTDVDELPWMTGGKIVNVIAMNKLYLGEN